MQELNILIVDDEKPARKKLRSFLLKAADNGTIFEAENGVQAVQMIREKQPHLVFLDIQMPGMTGFEVIEAVGVETMPVVVFVTAFDQYALNAFEVQAVDYLLKPFDQARFTKSFDRARKQLQLKRPQIPDFRRLLQEIHKEKKYLERIMVNVGSRYFFVKCSEIVYISAEEKYVKLHTAKENYLVRDTMNRLEERLDPDKFTRIHRSNIVHVDFIKEMQPWSHGDYVVILKTGDKLTLSRRYRDRLFDKIK